MLDPKYKNATPVHNSSSRTTDMAPFNHKKARKCNSNLCLQCAEMEKPNVFHKTSLMTIKIYMIQPLYYFKYSYFQNGLKIYCYAKTLCLFSFRRLFSCWSLFIELSFFNSIHSCLFVIIQNLL